MGLAMITPFVSLLLIASATLIGYLAQITGLCLVRGVRDWQSGNRIRLLAILSTGFWVYLYLPLVSHEPGAQPLHSYAAHWSFAIGGLLFGIGAAINGACSISTATRLASGDLAMLFTMVGWPVGWLLMDLSGIRIIHATHPFQPGWSAVAILLGMLVAGVAAHARAPGQWRLWLGISLVGILSGVVFLIQPAWSPSDFVRDVGLAVVHADATRLPAIERIVILGTMILGMAVGAWQYGHFNLTLPSASSLRRHLPAGILMGIGTALALGGNDFQILLGLPSLSLAALMATAGMLVGIGGTMAWKRRAAQ